MDKIYLELRVKNITRVAKKKRFFTIDNLGERGGEKKQWKRRDVVEEVMFG